METRVSCSNAGDWDPEAVTGQTGCLSPADGRIHTVYVYFSLYVSIDRRISGDH